MQQTSCKVFIGAGGTKYIPLSRDEDKMTGQAEMAGFMGVWNMLIGMVETSHIGH